MKLGMAHPMGPLQLADFIGLDVCLSILKVLQGRLRQSQIRPLPLTHEYGNRRLSQASKSGEGFYKYTPGSKDLVVSSRFIPAGSH
jgi:3-hydroxybutyryl-CoA dehydrogenase